MIDRPTLTGRAATALPSDGRRIVVTGAGGWIGRATLELLRNTLGPDEFGRRVIALGSSQRELPIGDFKVLLRPLDTLATLDRQPTLLIHLAFLTKDRAEWMEEDDYVRANRAVSNLVVENLDRIGTEAVFVASSGAASFAEDANASRAMRLYGTLKKADEDAFAQWAEDRGRRAVIGRLYAVSGPHINKHDTYALASFIKQAIAGEPITIRADFPVYRSYVAIRELMSVVFASMVDGGSDAVRFDTGGQRLEMQQIAEAVSDALGPVPINRPPLRNDKVDQYVGASSAYDELLAACGIEHLPFPQQVAETAAFFTSEADQSPLTKNDSARLSAAEGSTRANKRTIA